MQQNTSRKTTIINFHGGPSIGKSTAAAYMFYKLKVGGYNTELVREYIKNWAWQERPITTYDQIYFVGKQTHLESMLYGKVDYLITDAPVSNNIYYAQRYCTPTLVHGVCGEVMAFYKQAAEDGHRHVHILLQRSKPYAGDGRYQTEAEAIEIDHGIKKLLQDLDMSVITSSPDEKDIDKVLNDILGK